MLVSRENEKLQAIKVEKHKLKDDFKKKQSLIIKISIFYLVLTLANLLIFWIITGANQIGLIKDKAILQTQTRAYEIIDQLKPIMDNQIWSKMILNDKTSSKAIEMVYRSLKPHSEVDSLSVKSFRLISASGNVLTDYPNNDTAPLSKAKFQKVLKALQLREAQGKSFYGTPNADESPQAFEYTIELYIPLTSLGIGDVVFVTSQPLNSIRNAWYSLLWLAVAMVIVMIIVQTLFGFILYRMLVSPIAVLAKGAHQVAEGNLDLQVKVGKRSDELGQLMYLFNSMVANIKEKTSKLNTTIGELERHNEIMQNELSMAQSIQDGIMPKESNSDKLHVSIYYGPLEKVSGDYYDIFHLPDGSIGLLMTDASGHGVPAALVTIMAKMHFSSLAETETNPGELFAKVNEKLAKTIITSDYLTAFYLIVHPDFTVDYCNASHQKAVIYHRSKKTIEELDTVGFFIGAIEESPFPYENGRLQLEPGDRIILYTDGIVEGTNSKKEEYGFERFTDLIKKHAELPAEEFNRLIIQDVDEFAAGEPRKDDYSLFTIDIDSPELKQNRTKSNYKLGLSLYKQQEFEQALKIFANLYKEDSENLKVQLYYANTLFYAKRYREAAQVFEKYLETKDDNEFAHLKYGVSLAKQNDHDNAIKHYETAIKIKPELAEAYGQIALSYLHKNMHDEARQSIENALRIKPNDTHLLRVQEKIQEVEKAD